MDHFATNDAFTSTVAARLGTVALLGRLLQRLEQQPRGFSAEQYRAVAQRLAQALAEVPGDRETRRALQALMAAMPAVAEVYENLHYGHAGLCREPLMAAARAEVATRELIARVAARG